jgi:hypothetical protein
MDELGKMEKQESEKDDVPEDLTSFIQSLVLPISNSITQ